MSGRVRGRVWIVDDDPVFLDVAARMLGEDGYEIQRLERGRALLELFVPEPPECLLLDVRLPDIGWRSLLRGVLDRDPFAPIVQVTGSPEIELAVEALQEGAHDYLVKPVAGERLRAVVRTAIEWSLRAEGRRREAAGARRKLERLTPREREVLELIVEGLPSKVIAVQLSCSKKTIDVHRSSILRKLDVESVVGVVKIHMAAERPRRSGARAC